MSTREEEYAAKGVEIIAINALEDPATGRKWIEGPGSDLDLHWAFADDAVTEALGVGAVPTQILIDGEGKIVWTSSVSSIMGGADAVFAEIDKLL